jgi:O-antigen ligase
VFLAALGVYGLRRFGAKFAAVGATLALPLLLLGTSREAQEASQSSMERMEAWMTGLEFFKKDPIFGVGLGQFAELHWLTAHNSYLLVASETGIIGMFLWSTLLYLSVKICLVAYRRYRQVPEARVAADWALALLATMGSTMVGILFLSLSYHPILWLYFGLCAGLWHCIKTHDPTFKVHMGLSDFVIILAADATFLFLLAAYLRLKGEA